MVLDKQILKDRGLKVTPQRIAVLDAMRNLRNHPTADCIIDFVRSNHPNIAAGTVYKTLDTFVELGIIKKVKTERDVMRYDAITEKHHHLYCIESDKIEDFIDEELDKVLENFFALKKIPNFSIDDIKLQITGRFEKRLKE